MMDLKTLALVGGAIALQMTVGGGFQGMSEMKVQGEQAKQIRAQQQADQARLTLSEDARKQKDAIAKQRYKDGCLVVVSSQDKSKLTAITEGQPVIDSARKAPLSAGNIVCDQNGLTGEIVPSGVDAKGRSLPPVVANTAFTSDRQVVAQAMARMKGARYQPSGQ